MKPYSLLLCAFLGVGGLAHAQSLNQQANAASQAEDWPKAYELWGKVCEQEPNNANARLSYGYAAILSGHYEQAIPAYERAQELGADAGLCRYNVACAQSRLGRTDDALKNLEASFAAGFQNIGLAEKDPDLESIRGDARFAQILAKAKKPEGAGKALAERRQFDFWAGEWEVKTASGATAGSNKITLVHKGMALLEEWTDARGGTGSSLNAYDPQSKTWRQTWVDDGGNIRNFEGGWNGTQMVLATADAGGKRERMTFTPLPDGRVRQHGEHTEDGGATWKTRYDLYYSKRAGNAD